MATQRPKIYLVTEPDGTQRLVRALSKAPALEHCIRPYKVEIAPQDAIASLVMAGVRVEDATATEATAAPAEDAA